MNKQLAKISKAYKSLKDNDPQFWPKRDGIKDELREFLREDISTLSKKDLLLLSSLVSTLRPVEPFRYLNYLSIAYDKLNNNDLNPAQTED